MTNNLIFNTQDDSFNEVTSGIYGLISKSTEIDLRYNEITSGKAFVLAVESSKILMQDNILSFADYNVNQIENSLTYNNDNVSLKKYNLSSKNSIYNFPPVKSNITGEHYILKTDCFQGSKLKISAELGHTRKFNFMVKY